MIGVESVVHKPQKTVNTTKLLIKCSALGGGSKLFETETEKITQGDITYTANDEILARESQSVDQTVRAYF